MPNHKFGQRLAGIWNAPGNARRRWPVLTVLVGFAITVGWWIYDKAEGQHLYDIGQHFFTATLPRWTSEPVGAFSWTALSLVTLWSIGVVTFVLVMALVESRPVKTPKRGQLTNAEDQLIHPLRSAWKRFGEESSSALLNMFRGVAYKMREEKKAYWATLLTPIGDELDKRHKQLGTILANDAVEGSEQPVERVIVAFNELYRACRQAYIWLAGIDVHDIKLADEHAAALEGWRRLRRVFREQLEDVRHRRAFDGKLAIYEDPNAKYFDPVVHHVVLAAEGRDY